MAEAKPLERYASETRKAFEARRRYVLMGPSRTLKRVGEELGKSEGLMERWSSRWGWIACAAEFDATIDRETTKAIAAKLVADEKAKVAKWSRRDEEHNEGAYLIFIDSFNDIVEYRDEVKSGKRKANPREKQALQRSFALLDPIARLSRQEMQARIASAALAADGGKPLTGRALAVFSAVVEQAQHVPDGPGKRLAVFKAAMQASDDYEEPEPGV